ncbi:alpha-glucosidase [Lewinella cohaerens]|uniref:alpha-glucosidase n=1 Tax=Lewinella cohaerens TaxID=70995 RepID=UPI0003731734|nr:alpha-glucosidase [Lewinella cohaerens]
MTKTWWKEAVIYQIYPRSFKDSNGDGIGDLGGIIEKLDYLAELGVDLLWLSPIYQSPNDDNGYDISDYRDIMTEFGSMTQFDEMLQGIHDRGMKLMMDLVVNHSSNEHHWFQESRKGPDNPYRDYYIWRKEKPVRWPSFFGGEAWEYDELSGEYYLHLFSKKQPDLNWENPKLREEVYEMMRFWLDKGVDGFRMDVIPFISKRLHWPEVDWNDFPKIVEEVYANGPRLHEFLQEMKQEALVPYDVATVGEAPGVPASLGNLYVGESRQELDMIFHFGHMFLDWGPKGKFEIKDWNLKDFKGVFNDWYAALGEEGWVSIFLDNHDFPRMVSRWGDDGTYRETSAKLLAILLLSLRGTPSIYQGSEIGMTNVAFPSIDDYRDLETINAWTEAEEKGEDLDQLLLAIHKQGRDNVRTPIQWDDSSQAGFTTALEPWINVNPNYKDINAAAVLSKPDSIFYFYQRLLRLRKQYLTWVYGEYEMIDGNHSQLYAYRRWDAEATFYFYLNFSETELTELPGPPLEEMELIIGNYPDHKYAHLRAWEARVYRI